MSAASVPRARSFHNVTAIRDGGGKNTGDTMASRAQISHAATAARARIVAGPIGDVFGRRERGEPSP
jgi:hypothetical protein